MQEIAVYDLDGNTLTNLVQYDTDVYIHIKDSRITAAYQVQFFNSTSESALVMKSTYSNGVLSVKIPNDLLSQPYTITGYVNVKKNGESKCLYGFRVAVRKKPQPNDWVHVDSKDYVTFEEIVEECREFAQNASTSATNAKASEIAASNSAINAKYSEQNAKKSEEATDRNVELTNEYANAAEIAEENAFGSEKKAAEYAALSVSYAVGEGSEFLLSSDGEIISSDDGSQLFAAYARNEEATDNAKYYFEQSKQNAQEATSSKNTAVTSATNAKASEIAASNSATNALLSETNSKASETNAAQSESNAKISEDNAKNSEDNALVSATNAKSSETNAANSAAAALSSENNAKTSETNASASEQNAQIYADNARLSETNAAQSEMNAKDSETNAANSENNAKTSETNAQTYADNANSDADRAEAARIDVEDYASLSKSYAVGTDNNIRDNDRTDNAKYYYEQSRQISAGLSGALLPMGTIPFSDLSIQTKMAGYMFNISDSFVTDATFKDGAGAKYPAGTNVYYTADGYWDCLAGSLVTGVKGNKESTYRTGDINLTPENIGAQSIEDAADMQDSINDINENINNINDDIVNIQTDIQGVKDNIDSINDDMDTYVKDLLGKVSDLEDTVAFLEEMIYTRKAVLAISDDEGNNIVTNEGDNLCAWYDL